MRAYEIIREVTRINPDDTLYDEPKQRGSSTAIKLFEHIRDASNGFSIPASQLYDIQEQANLVHQCVLSKADLKEIFDKYDQPMRAINELLRYLKKH